MTALRSARQRASAFSAPDAVTFAECERLAEEELTYVRDALLKERALHWRTELGAMAV